jgi:site-specific DNA recombinase
LIRAAIYARVSTEEQGEKYGLTSQVTELRALAAERGYTVQAGTEFVDDGVSGTTLERPALERLREAARLAQVQRLLILDPDRLSRRLVHQLLLLDEFKRHGVTVEFLRGSSDDTAEGRLLLNVQGVIAEYEREKIQSRTLRGKREKARRGLVVASFPYGYRPDPGAPGRLLVHEPEASVVRMIYGWLIDEGRSTRSIVDELRRLAIPPGRAGRKWGPTQVRRILTSDRYTGRTYYNRGQVVSGGGRKERPAAEWIAVPIPVIVTPERHAAAQAQLARNRSALVGRPARFAYLLRGLLRCGVCGIRYEGIPSHGRRYYRCHGRDRFTPGARCRSPWMSAAVAEAVVWNAVAEALRRPEALRRAVERYDAARGARDVELKSRAEHLRRQLRAVEHKERRLLDLYLDDVQVATAEVLGRLQALARERARLTEELERAEGSAVTQGVLEARQDAVERWCAQARRGLARLDQQGRRKLLAALVDEIRVGRDRTLEIYGILPAREADTELRRPA